ncbi:MAG: lipid A export permease/ATP-binding protein MsbA [Nevskia sp.]|nr:lipid A export permease/ATP-binding protein MsbA [Nevskia sp.]
MVHRSTGCKGRPAQFKRSKVPNCYHDGSATSASALNTAAKPSYSPAAVYRRLLRYSAPHWKVLILALLGMVVFGGSDAVMVYLVKGLTNTFTNHDRLVIRWLPWAILGLFLVRAVANFTAAYGMAWVGQGVVAKMRQQVFSHLLHVPVSYHDRSRTADLQAKLTYHASQIADSASSVLASVIQGGISATVLLGSMFYYSWRLTLFALLIVPFVALSIDWVNRRFRTVSTRVQNSMGGMTHAADEAITGRRVVKLYGGESFVLGAFRQLNEYLRRQSLKMTEASAISTSSLELIAAIGVSFLVGLATSPRMLEAMSPGDFVAFVVAMLALRQPISSMTGLSERVQRGVVAGADLFAFLDTPVEQDSGSLPLARAHGALRFEEVRFSYDEDQSDALAGVTLDVPAGKTVAFVGQSGGGKSTLLSLIPRFYDPAGGRVLLDGVDLRDYKLADLRRQIALVDQNVVLFNASIGENIAYGEAGATRERIEQAARRACAWDFIQKLPQGLDTPLGQDGGGLSGGQRQRIAIARALYKDAPILILDEATSALDTESERYIQQGLEELMRGRTTLVIAHRLSTVQSADLIVVIQNGRVVEQGSNAELLARNGVYASLHRLQFRESEEAA